MSGNAGVTVLKGIRFARTARRYAAPVDMDEGWDADAVYGAQCPQVPGVMERLLGQGRLPSAEDCHFLNVFTPACDEGRRPVLVWVHGGAFVNGTGAMPWYHGAELARRYDVVVVTLNYRLGAFGFAHLAEHHGEHDGDDWASDSGNLGLLDQLSALRWVQRHATEVGGDPGNVTIFGESAGGASVVTLLAAPGGAGLFHRAVALSPSLTQLRDRARAHEAAAGLLDAAGTSAPALRDLPVDALLSAQQAVLADRAGAFTAFAPTPGEPSLPESVVAAAARNPVPLLIGTNRDEMLLWSAFDARTRDMDDAELARYADERFGEAATHAVTAYRAARPGWTPGQVASAIATDETFRVPARRLAEARAAAGHPTWMHWFTWTSPAFGGMLGSCHALDIPFVFRNLTRPGVEAFTGDAPEREHIADMFSGAVATFARHGDPGWTRFDTTRRATLRIDVEPTEVDDPEPELRELWDPLGSPIGGAA